MNLSEIQENQNGNILQTNSRYVLDEDLSATHQGKYVLFSFMKGTLISFFLFCFIVSTGHVAWRKFKVYKCYFATFIYCDMIPGVAVFVIT